MKLYDKIQETVAFIRQRAQQNPSVAIILGSGLGGLMDVVRKEVEISYKDIPHFPLSTVVGHDGKLIFGTIGSKQVVMMAGRFHYYEGYSMEELSFPVRVMKFLGAETLMLSNAAGGMNPEYEVGDIMLIQDHINLFPEHPLRGPNDDRLGTRFPDMSEPYDLNLIRLAENIAAERGVKIHKGVYAGLQGPSFETRAEYEYLHRIGGDVVGMSTVPEVIVAIHSGMKCFALSVVTDLGIREELNKITHEEVLEAANAAAPKVAGIVGELVKRI